MVMLKLQLHNEKQPYLMRDEKLETIQVTSTLNQFSPNIGAVEAN